MVNYRRNFIKGGSYFFTVNLKNRQSTLLIDAVNQLRASFSYVHSKKPFEVIAIVILPEHLHCIWQLPENDKDYPARWKSIKSHFTRQLKKTGLQISKNKHNEHDLWQRRYWEHTIRDENDLTRHIDYIHYNPVKHGWVESVSDWEYSSFHKYTSRGYECGIYSELIFVESKALKQAHSKLCNCFSNAAFGTKSAARNPQSWPCEVYVKKGSLPPNWGNNFEISDTITYGERSLDAVKRNQGMVRKTP